MRKKKSRRKHIYLAVAVMVVLINAIAYFIAFSLTHFSSQGQLGGIIPRPINNRFPSNMGLEYVTHRIVINESEWLEAWLIPTQQPSQGTVLLFPGKNGSKKQLLMPAKVFHNQGYDCLLVDFRGVGGSSGNTTTVGVREGKDVALTVNYLQNLKLKSPIILYGVSMGSSAILRSIYHEGVKPDGIILELPFGRLLNAVRNRFIAAKIPSFPLAELVVFWGGFQYGFNGFSHNPLAYAKLVKCPSLVFHGEKDKLTKTAEVKELFNNLGGTKQLVIFPTASHQLLVTMDEKLWSESIDKFLKTIKQ